MQLVPLAHAAVAEAYALLIAFLIHAIAYYICKLHVYCNHIMKLLDERSFKFKLIRNQFKCLSIKCRQFAISNA